MQIDITTADVTALKSLAYDKLAIIEQASAELRAINEQILKRNQGEARTEPIEPESPVEVEEKA